MGLRACLIWGPCPACAAEHACAVLLLRWRLTSCDCLVACTPQQTVNHHCFPSFLFFPILSDTALCASKTSYQQAVGHISFKLKQGFCSHYLKIQICTSGQLRVLVFSEKTQGLC